MIKFTIAAAVTTAITLASSMALANESMEKCKVVKDGKGLIKEHKADCTTSSHSCAGGNKAGEAEAWIYVPKGECAKINAGDFNGVDQKIKDKLEHAN